MHLKGFVVVDEAGIRSSVEHHRVNDHECHPP